jgi:hypothetical protein
VKRGFMPAPWRYVLLGQAMSLESGPLQDVQGVVAGNEK